MLEQLINHSIDLNRLRKEGYEITVIGGYLVVTHIPYVNQLKQIAYGTLVSSLTINGNQTMRPDSHVIHFIGGHPCGKDGSIITAIQHASNRTQLHQDLTVDHSFSNRPSAGYTDYYEKISTYADIISAPAKSLDKNVTEKTFKIPPDKNEESVFQYPDTNSSRAEINMINAKFNGQKVAIIGLGGTGAYILDLVAKTQVSAIHLFDGDFFLQHNSFRSPGAASMEQLTSTPKKVYYYASMYDNMHKHIVAHDYYISENTLETLNQMSFIFICVDKNSVRKMIIAHLLKKGISFIDTGLGVEVVDDFLIGTLRITAGTPLKGDHIASRVSTEDLENEDYASNIQLADLNSLTAALAVVKWKKMSGFYQDLIQYHNCTYTINAAQLSTTDFTA